MLRKRKQPEQPITSQVQLNNKVISSLEAETKLISDLEVKPFRK